MGHSGRDQKDQNAKKNEESRDPGHKILEGNEKQRTGSYLCYTSAENLDGLRQ